MQVKKQAVIYHENTKNNLGTPKKKQLSLFNKGYRGRGIFLREK